MTTTADFADFVQTTDYDDLSPAVVDGVKQRVLDALGIAIGSIGDEPVEIVRETVTELDPEGGPCTLWGDGRTASPPEATMLNTALVRYLDFMDAILVSGEAPHPSDDIAAAVATAESAGRSGAELLAGIAIAYEVHGELAAKAPGRDIGWDHIHVTFASAAAAAKLLGLDHEQTRNAIGIVAASYNPLRVTRTGKISMWKGIASANMARNAVYTAMLARNGMEGPTDAFEGQKGWKEIVQGRDFQVEFTPGERVLEVMTKKYMAGTHAQTGIDALLDLVERHELDPTEIEAIDVRTYRGAAHVMGGGEGDRHLPENREQADHSLPYSLAAAVLDGQLLKEQYAPERIVADDVRSLMRTISVEEDPALTERMRSGDDQPFAITVRTTDGREYDIERASYEGHPTDPISWESLEEKFHGLAAQRYDVERRDAIVDVVRTLEERDVAELTTLLD